MSFEPFQNFLKRAANIYGVGRELDAAAICHSFREISPEIFNSEMLPEIEQNVTPAHFKDSTLTLNVTSSAWAQEVIMRKTTIIQKMNERAGKKIIKDLKSQLSSPELSPDSV